MADEKPPVTALPNGSERPRKRRWPLWPWVVGTIVVVVGSAAFSFWWPMHQANRVIEFINSHDGWVEYETEHPGWIAFLDVETFHPWFDRVDMIYLYDEVDDSVLQDLRWFSEIKHLELNVSRFSHSAIENLSQFDNLQTLHLLGDGEAIPLDWIDSNPNLVNFGVRNIPVSEADAELIKSLSSLEWLDLHDCQISPEFWTSLSHHRTLKSLTLNNVELDDDGLKELERISTLKLLTVAGTHATVEGLADFKDARPDVSLR